MAASKYRSRKTECALGHLHDSKKEAKRCTDLHLMQKAGVISDLRLQVKYELIPASYEDVPTGRYYVKGLRRGEPIMKRKCVERPCYYIADFVYSENGKTVIEDCKGMRTKEYTIKRKLMRQMYCNDKTIFKET